MVAAPVIGGHSLHQITTRHARLGQQALCTQRRGRLRGRGAARVDVGSCRRHRSRTAPDSSQHNRGAFAVIAVAGGVAIGRSAGERTARREAAARVGSTPSESAPAAARDLEDDEKRNGLANRKHAGVSVELLRSCFEGRDHAAYRLGEQRAAPSAAGASSGNRTPARSRSSVPSGCGWKHPPADQPAERPFDAGGVDARPARCVGRSAPPAMRTSRGTGRSRSPARRSATVGLLRGGGCARRGTTAGIRDNARRRPPARRAACGV